MSRLDRYIFAQIIGPFLFFVLVFAGVIWLALSLRVIDTVVTSGQSALVFAEFIGLLAPKVLVIVLPVAAFAGTLYAINRLYADSEVVVMFASGISAPRLLWPVSLFALLVMLATAAMTTYLAPMAQRATLDRISEIRGDVAAAFLRPGTFVTPEAGVTVYMREMPRPGEMLGIFVHDARDPDGVVSYTAERAVLLENAPGPRLVMFDGVAQTAGGPEGDALSILRFEQLGYDLSQFNEGGADRVRKPSELYLPELLSIRAEDAGNRGLGAFRAEAHEALSAPLYVLALPLLGVAIIIAGGFKRHGFGKRILVAVAAAVGLRLLGLAVKSAVSGLAALWPLMYLPPLAGIAFAVWLMAISGRGIGQRLGQVGGVGTAGPTGGIRG
ncbi:MAG: LPS export ABC transporter permease LptF [Pseudomonadota bacterium]